MARHHMTPDGLVPFTAEEEVYRDAQESARAQVQPAPAPTKEELLAQVQALTAQIQALA